MRRIFHAFSLLFLTVFFTRCQKEVGYVGGPDPNTGSNLVIPSPVTANLQGNVFDENGQPAAGVTITVGTQVVTTTGNGFFRVLNASLDKNASLVKAEKSGYFKAFRSFSATSGTNQVVIKLIKKTSAGTIPAASGGDVNLSNGTKISLPASGVVVASSGAAYSGTVNVYAAYIDPTAGDISQTVPGSFMANDKDGKRVTLASYGMMAVELEGAAGEKLQIKSGSVATLTSPIPSSIQSSAPATIALWSIDEQTGLWKEEGTATKNGTNYIGTVSHFSFWNCDIGIPAINLQLTVNNSAGQPITHAHVRIRRVVNNAQTYGWTDSLGKVSGLVPSNENLVLEVLDQCNNAIYSQNIGPFAVNTNLGVITVTGTSTSSMVTVTGTLLTCSGTPVTNGYAVVTLGNYHHYVAVGAGGSFSTVFLTCTATTGGVQVLGVDGSNQQQGTASAVAITTPVTNVGNVTACGTSAVQFINYTVDGTSYAISSTNVADSLTMHTSGNGTTILTTVISGFRVATGDKINFSFTHPSPVAGTYPMAYLSVQTYNQTTIIQPLNVVVTNYPTAVGQFMEGTFTGQFKDATNVTHNLSGSFKLRRQ